MWFLLPTFFQLDLSVCLTPRQQGQWHRPVIVLTACVPVGWRRVMGVFHYGLDGWVRLADADRQQMCKVGGWFVKGSTASRRRWRAMPGGGKLRWGRLSVIVHRCHRKVKVSSHTVAVQALIRSENFSPTTQLCQMSLSLIVSFFFFYSWFKQNCLPVAFEILHIQFPSGYFFSRLPP